MQVSRKFEVDWPDSFLGVIKYVKKFKIGKNQDFPYGFRKSPVLDVRVPDLF